jgi:predicted nucleic-acid-binding protein
VIGVDTNILVRYLVQDDPLQSPRATKIVEERFTRDEPGYISLVTLVETLWVLERPYGLSPTALADAVDLLLSMETLVIQNEREVFIATHALRSGTASFSDALIGALGAWAGCSTTVTFDRKAARLPQFTLA